MSQGNKEKEIAQLKLEIARLKQDKLKLMLAVRMMLSTWEMGSPLDRENSAKCATNILDNANQSDRPC